MLMLAERLRNRKENQLTLQKSRLKERTNESLASKLLDGPRRLTHRRNFIMAIAVKCCMKRNWPPAAAAPQPKLEAASSKRKPRLRRRRRGRPRRHSSGGSDHDDAEMLTMIETSREDALSAAAPPQVQARSESQAQAQVCQHSAGAAARKRAHGRIAKFAASEPPQQSPTQCKRLRAHSLQRQHQAPDGLNFPIDADVSDRSSGGPNGTPKEQRRAAAATRLCCLCEPEAAAAAAAPDMQVQALAAPMSHREPLHNLRPSAQQTLHNNNFQETATAKPSQWAAHTSCSGGGGGDDVQEAEAAPEDRAPSAEDIAYRNCGNGDGDYDASSSPNSISLLGKQQSQIRKFIGSSSSSSRKKENILNICGHGEENLKNFSQIEASSNGEGQEEEELQKRFELRRPVAAMEMHQQAAISSLQPGLSNTNRSAGMELECNANSDGDDHDPSKPIDQMQAIKNSSQFHIWHWDENNKSDEVSIWHIEEPTAHSKQSDDPNDGCILLHNMPPHLSIMQSFRLTN